MSRLEPIPVFKALLIVPVISDPRPYVQYGKRDIFGDPLHGSKGQIPLAHMSLRYDLASSPGFGNPATRQATRQ
jgi:hypothetical protein